MHELNLPVHPSMRHPLTGELLRALWVRPDGRVMWPIMGGAPDGDGDGGGGSGDGSGGSGGTGDGGDKGGNDGGAGDGGSGAGDKGGDSGDGGDAGFPKDTPVEQMKPAEQAAYWRHQARKHETRNKEWQTAAGGKTAAEIAAERKELDELRTKNMSDGEKAVAEAVAKGRREAALALAPQMFDVALAHVKEDRRKVLIESIDMNKVLTDSGTVDAAKVKTIADTLAPAGKEGEGRRRDYGAGDRRTDKTSGIASGRDLARERHGGKSETQTTSS